MHDEVRYAVCLGNDKLSWEKNEKKESDEVEYIILRTKAV